MTSAQVDRSLWLLIQSFHEFVGPLGFSSHRLISRTEAEMRPSPHVHMPAAEEVCQSFVIPSRLIPLTVTFKFVSSALRVGECGWRGDWSGDHFSTRNRYGAYRMRLRAGMREICKILYWVYLQFPSVLCSLIPANHRTHFFPSCLSNINELDSRIVQNPVRDLHQQFHKRAHNWVWLQFLTLVSQDLRQNRLDSIHADLNAFQRQELFALHFLNAVPPSALVAAWPCHTNVIALPARNWSHLICCGVGMEDFYVLIWGFSWVGIFFMIGNPSLWCILTVVNKMLNSTNLCIDYLLKLEYLNQYLKSISQMNSSSFKIWEP